MSYTHAIDFHKQMETEMKQLVIAGLIKKLLQANGGRESQCECRAQQAIKGLQSFHENIIRNDD